jgi:hypothetical protein
MMEGSGSRRPKNIQDPTDPDPQNCFNLSLIYSLLKSSDGMRIQIELDNWIWILDLMKAKKKIN